MVIEYFLLGVSLVSYPSCTLYCVLTNLENSVSVHNNIENNLHSRVDQNVPQHNMESYGNSSYWLWKLLLLVVETPVTGYGNSSYWLWKLLLLVVETPLTGCGNSSYWLWKLPSLVVITPCKSKTLLSMVRHIQQTDRQPVGSHIPPADQTTKL